MQNLVRVLFSYLFEWLGVVGVMVDGFVGGWKWLLNGDMSFIFSQCIGMMIDNSLFVIQFGYVLFNSCFIVILLDDKYLLGLYVCNIIGKGYCVSKVYQVLEGLLGLCYDINGDGVNDGMVVCCFVGELWVIGVMVGVKF